MTCICIGPVCIPIYSILPFVLLFLSKCWAWLSGQKPKEKVDQDEDELSTNCCDTSKDSDLSSTLCQRKEVKANVITMTSTEDWKNYLELSSETPLVVDFTATWCGPCKRIAPLFAELSAEYPNANFVKVDVDELDDVMVKCGVRAMPTFQVYKDKEKVDEVVGAEDNKLRAMVEKHAS